MKFLGYLWIFSGLIGGILVLLIKQSLRLVAIFVFSLLALLITTPPDLMTPFVRWGLDQVVRELPEQFSYQSIALHSQGFVLNQLKFTDETLTVTLETLNWSGSLWGLLQGHLAVEAVELAGVTVHLHPPPNEDGSSSPFEPPTFALPLTASLNHLRLRDFRLIEDGKTLLNLADAKLRAVFDGQKLSIQTLNATFAAPIDGHLQATGDLIFRDHWPLRVDLVASMEIPELDLPRGPLPVVVAGRITGDLAQLVTEVSAGYRENSNPYNALVALQAEIISPTNQHQLTWKTQLTGELAPFTALFPLEPPLNALNGAFILEGTGDLDRYRVALEGQITGVPEVQDVAIKVALVGDADALQISALKIDTPLGNLQGTGDFRVADQHLRATLTTSPLQWPFEGTPDLKVSKINLNILGSPTDTLALDLEGQFTAQAIDLYDELSLLAQLTVNPQQVQIEPFTLRGKALDLRGTGRFDLDELTLQLTLNSPESQLPLDPKMSVKQLNIQLSGAVADDDFPWQMQFSTALENEEFPPLRVESRLQGDQNRVSVDQLTVSLLDGQLGVIGELDWHEALAWRARVTGNRLNLSRYPGLNEFPSQIDFALDTQGTFADSPTMVLELRELKGQLRQQPLEGTGQFRFDGKTLAIQPLTVRYGTATASLEGEVRNLDRTVEQIQATLDTQLNIPDFAPLLPEARGQFRLDAALSGALLTPQFRYRLQGQQLGWRQDDTNLFIERIEGHGNIDGADRQPSSLALQINNLQFNELSWNRLSFTGSGTMRNHQLSVQLNGEPLTAEMTLQGRFEATQGTWRGQLTQSQLTRAEIGTWRQAAATPIALQASRAELGPLCWQSPPARLCIEGNWRDTQGANARLNLERWPLSRLPLPDTLSVNQELTVNSQFRQSAGGQISGQLNGRLNSGVIGVLVEGRSIQLPFDGVSLAVELASLERGQANLEVNARDLLQVNSVLNWQGDRLTGQINARGSNFAPFFVLLPPQIVNPQMALQSDLQISGRYPNLEWQGRAALTNLAADIPAGNVRFQGGELALIGRGGELSLSGRLNSVGTLEINGQLDPLNQSFNATLKGREFNAWNGDEIKAVIAPDLTVTGNKNAVRVTGTVEIPSLFVAPTELAINNRVQPSSDIRIRRPATVDPQETELAQSPFDLTAAINILLGRVTVQAAGFEGNLKGRLRIEQTPQLPPRALGELEVETGEYVVFGRALEITEGRVLFGGGPITNPGLQLAVQQDFGNLVAGARVTGTAREPRITLFSNPTQSDTVIASYLLYGRAPDDRSGQENALLLQLATNLARGGVAAANPLAKQLGLADLELGSGASGANGTALTIGKYLTPNLYVGYGVGLFDAVNTFMLRYRLTQNLSLRASSNENAAGGDITWTIRRE